MDNSVDATIEKIKLQEQIKETKLKEKREFATFKRSIRDAKAKADKLKQDIAQMQLVTDNLQYQINVERYQKDALSNQLNKLYTEHNQLRTESERKIASVWELRADLCETMKLIAESCDVRNLLIKSTGIDIAALNARNQKHSENAVLNKNKLQTALEKREEAINKRRNLLDKPEKDDEFIRIKEALRYSEQMVANIKNQLK